MLWYVAGVLRVCCCVFCGEYEHVFQKNTYIQKTKHIEEHLKSNTKSTYNTLVYCGRFPRARLTRRGRWSVHQKPKDEQTRDVCARLRLAVYTVSTQYQYGLFPRANWKYLFCSYRTSQNQNQNRTYIIKAASHTFITVSPSRLPASQMVCGVWAAAPSLGLLVLDVFRKTYDRK